MILLFQKIDVYIYSISYIDLNLMFKLNFEHILKEVGHINDAFILYNINMTRLI
jgi:hypothetical protein